MKGIILAGGSGTRLYPLTIPVSKQLMPVYDKPMIYYPLTTLMLAGIREILIITTPQDQQQFQTLLGDGSQWGLNIQYAEQQKPEGIAQAFIIGESFTGNDTVCLILGDNIFYGGGFAEMLTSMARLQNGATILAYYVREPEKYGVVEFDSNRKPIAITEKPEHPRSNYAVTGLYFYDNRVASMARSIKPSRRGELEITDINQLYLEQDLLTVKILGRGMAWLDTGTHESLFQATNFIEVIESRQGLKIACPEEIAYRMNYIDAGQLKSLAEKLSQNNYGQYLMNILDRE